MTKTATKAKAAAKPAAKTKETPTNQPVGAPPEAPEEEVIEAPEVDAPEAPEPIEAPDATTATGKFWKGRYHVQGIGLIEGEVKAAQIEALKKFRPNLDPATMTSNVDPKEAVAKRKAALKRKASTGK